MRQELGIEYVIIGSVLEYEMGYLEQLTDVHVAASRLEEMAAVAVLP